MADEEIPPPPLKPLHCIERLTLSDEEKEALKMQRRAVIEQQEEAKRNADPNQYRRRAR